MNKISVRREENSTPFSPVPGRNFEHLLPGSQKKVSDKSGPGVEEKGSRHFGAVFLVMGGRFQTKSRQRRPGFR